MSNNSTLKFSLAVGAIFIIIFATGVSKLTVGTPTVNKADQLKAHHEILRHTEKLDMPIKLEIVNLHKKDMESNKAFTLVAKVNSDLDLSNYKLEWHIPKNIEILQGMTIVDNINLSAGNSNEYEIQLKSELENNEQIHLTFKSNDLANPYTKTVQYNTLLQEEIETNKQRILQKNKDYQKTLSKHKKIVF